VGIRGRRRRGGDCPGQKAPFFAVKHTPRPHRSAIQTRFTMEVLVNARNRRGRARTVARGERTGVSARGERAG
jgi:hypothetical protein